jgi:hypothetical protein
VYIIKENTEALVVAREDTGLKVSADKSKYMVMSRNQIAGRSHNITKDNISFEREKTAQIFGKNLKG